MKNPEIDKIIVKFLTNTASIQELEILKNLLKDKKNKQLFKNYVKINYAIDLDMKQFDANSFKREYLNTIKKDKKIFSVFKLKHFIRYAAAVILFLGLGYFVKENISKSSINEKPIIVNNNIKIGTDKATLTLEDGSQIALEKGQDFINNNLTSNGEELIYNSKPTAKAEIVYNYLTIPRGGQYFVKLSDGTQVWLNSESQLKYPVNFIEGQPREVKLIYGEAYFDVSPSTDHNGTKFRVFTENQKIEVLGTEFNINAYKDEKAIYTTLVEGKVIVNSETIRKKLAPGEQSKFNRLDKTIGISEVDVYSQISWKEGVFSFKDKPLKYIMTILSRWYDFKVLFENKDVEKDLFGGVFSKDQNIKDILNMIENLDDTIRFEILEKTIIVK